VGRGTSSAYAYFFYNRWKRLTPEARKRLKTISEATELGAGFAIAMKDLEIRGAGNLLGVEQSGYIAAVGFDLYSRLLGEAVEELKQGGAVKKEEGIYPSAISVNLPLPAFISEEYMPDLTARLGFYQRLAVIKKPQEIDDIKRELNDRFGSPPEELANLLYIVELKQLATEANIESISTENKQIVLNFYPGRDLSRLALSPDTKAGVRVGRDRIKLDIKILGRRWEDILMELVRSLLSVQAV